MPVVLESLVVEMHLKKLSKRILISVKSITDKPFGVNIMLLSPFADDIVDLVIEEGVKLLPLVQGILGNIWIVSTKLALLLFQLYLQ